MNAKFGVVTRNLKSNTSLTPMIRKVKTKWLLEDCSFICVFPTDLKFKNNENVNKFDTENCSCLKEKDKGSMNIITYSALPCLRGTKPPCYYEHP